MALKKKTKKTNPKKPKMASRVSRQTKPRSSFINKRWFVAAGVVLGLGLSLGVSYWWYTTIDSQLEKESEQQLMPIRLVEIQGSLEQVSKKQLLDVLRSQSRKQDEGIDAEKEGINFLTTDLIDLEEQLKQIPWIYDVKVRRVWPDKLVLEVQEQDAIAYWNNDYVVNRFGETFRPETMPEGTLPVLTGPQTDLAMMLKKFAALQQTFEAAELQLKELHLSERRSWNMKLANGTELRVGRKDLDERVNLFIDLYPLLVSENKAPIEWVDLRYDTGLSVMYMDTHQLQASIK